MKIHPLKTKAAYWDRVASGDKPFDLRVNDRDFQRGDQVVLIRQPSDENDPLIMSVGEELTREITYVLSNFDGLEAGYCILGLREVGQDLRESDRIEMLEVLQRVEWVNGTCPICLASRHDDGGFHTEGCELARLIREEIPS